MNIKNILKNNAMALIALALTTTIGFSAYKKAENKIISSPVWYELEVINPSLPQTPDNLKISNVALAPPVEDQGNFCGTKNAFDSCMARIETQNLSNPTDILNLSVEQAHALNAPITPEPEGDGYARSQEE